MSEGQPASVFEPPRANTETPYLEEDNDGADEHADTLEQVAHHVDEGRSHTGVGLLRPPS